MSTFASSLRALVPTAALVSMALAGTTASAASLTEGFEVVPVAGWTTVNNSTTVGTIGWSPGNLGVFSAQAGTTGSFIGASFNSTTGANTISNWLISPTLSFNNGDVVSFFTRTEADSGFPDRLELRFSSVGGVNVGTTDDSVGTFSRLLLSVNSGLLLGGYPEVWTQFSSTISGLSGPTNAAIAFRYHVTNGGPDGANSNYIGIDTLSITPVPEPAAYLMLALGLGVIALRRRAAGQN